MSQSDAILNHLKSGKPITALEALNNYGCFRLAARVNDLREEGHHILTETVCRNGKAYAVYLIPRPISQLEMAI